MVLSDILRSLVQIRLEGVFVVVGGESYQVDVQLGHSTHQFLNSLVVRISACHVEGLGSIPSWGEIFLVAGAYFSVPVSHIGVSSREGCSCKIAPQTMGKKELAIRGIEPVTFALLARRSNQLS